MIDEHHSANGRFNSTDTQVGRTGLRVLRDGLALFRRSDGVVPMRAAVDETARAAALAGHIDEAPMVEFNAQTKFDSRR